MGDAFERRPAELKPDLSLPSGEGVHYCAWALQREAVAT